MNDTPSVKNQWWKGAGTVGSIVLSLVVLFSLLNGIPWASKGEMSRVETIIGQLQAIQREQGEAIVALKVDLTALKSGIERIEAKLDRLMEEQHRRAPLPPTPPSQSPPLRQWPNWNP